MEKDRGRERVRDGRRGVLENNSSFFRFLRAARDAFLLYLHGVLEGERHGVVLISSVRCLRR